MSDWVLLAFLLFIGALAVFIGWFIDMAQKTVDRHLDERDDIHKTAEAMRRWPP